MLPIWMSVLFQGLHAKTSTITHKQLLQANLLFAIRQTAVVRFSGFSNISGSTASWKISSSSSQIILQFWFYGHSSCCIWTFLECWPWRSRYQCLNGRYSWCFWMVLQCWPWRSRPQQCDRTTHLACREFRGPNLCRPQASNTARRFNSSKSPMFKVIPFPVGMMGPWLWLLRYSRI